MVASKNVSLVLLKILPPTANAALVTTTHPVFFKKNFDPVNWLVEETSHLRYSLIPWAEKTSFSYERKGVLSSAILDFMLTGGLPCVARPKTFILATIRASAF